MKKKVMSIMLVLVMVLSLMPATAFAAKCPSCGNEDGTHEATCRFICPTDGCTVTYDSATSEYVHSDSNCLYSDDDMYCEECGYLTYNEEEKDYLHASTCSIGYPDSSTEDIGKDNPPAPIAQEYTVDGVTYFGVKSNNFNESTKLFIQDMLSAKNDDALGGKSTAALWQYLAYCIQDDKGRGTDTGKFKTQFDNVISNGLACNTGSTGTYSANIHNGDNNYNVRSSGLIYANSMSEAAYAMEEQMYKWYRQAGGGRNDKYGDADDAAIANNSTLANDTDIDDVFWMVTGAYKTSGTNKKGHYQALGVLFSDFTITTILPDDDGEFYQSNSSEPTAGSTTYASDVKNMTGVPVSAQQEISNTTSTSATSVISGSKAYGFEESVEVGYEHGLLGGKGHVNVSFTASQTIESGWSDEKSCSDEQTTSYNVAVELPAYTNVMLKQNTSEATTTTKYNCPVALNFTVTIVEYTLDPTYNNASCKTQVLATFGANARKNLNQRGVIEYTLTDPDGIAWGNLYNNHNGLRSIVEEKLTATAPMASAGATFTVVDKSVTSEISGLAPIYALSTVKTENGVMEYNLSSGEYLFVDSIGLEGLNRQNAAYYGFNPDKGHWILVDANEEELTDSSVAKLETNTVTGYTKLVAGNEEGTVYLKYLINEDCYATAEHPNTYANNETLNSTAMIEVNVSEIPFANGSIEIKGELRGIVGDPAKAIEGNDGLTAKIQDETGKYVSRPVAWDAQELPNDGIIVENNQISFTKEGTFHVRATTGEVRSEWYEVTALPARELAVIEIPAEVPLDYKYQQTLDLAGLQINYKDQYGDEWKDIPTLTWTCNDEDAVISDEGVLTVPSAGVYTVTASAEDITSNTLTITVTDSRASVSAMTPASKNLYSSGGSVEFTITGTNLMNGIEIKADDSIKANTEGTDTEQKATLTFPANTDTTSKKTYTVTNSQDNTITATVTVANKSYGGGGGGGGGAAIVKPTTPVQKDETIIKLTAGSIRYTVDGANKAMDAAPYIDSNNRTMVPIRFIAESLGAQVVWDAQKQSITITDGKNQCVLVIGESNYTLNGELKTMDTVAVIVNDRTMVPLRFIAEGLGGSVDWNAQSKTITVTKAK